MNKAAAALVSQNPVALSTVLSAAATSWNPVVLSTVL